LAERDESGRAEVAPTLLAMAASAGARSLRITTGSLTPGAFADLIAIDLGHPALEGWGLDSLPALVALSAPKDVITDVWVGGVQRVAERRHPKQEGSAYMFRDLMRRLG
ncbi:MAG: amidohydrolase family protein, partial [Candidatus Rokuibacteriota bacterium]